MNTTNVVYYLYDGELEQPIAAFPNVGRALNYCLEYYGSHITLSSAADGIRTNVVNINGGLLATIRPLPFCN